MAGTDGSVDDRTENMGTGYVVGNDSVPLKIISSPVGGPLASIRSEAADLLQLLRDFATTLARVGVGMELHREGCWQTASWDVFPNGNTTQLWKTTLSNEQPAVLADFQPIAMQQSLECCESTRYAFHWCEDPALPLLQVHSNRQQDSIRWGCDGLVAGTDGSVDDRVFGPDTNFDKPILNFENPP